MSYLTILFPRVTLEESAFRAKYKFGKPRSSRLICRLAIQLWFGLSLCLPVATIAQSMPSGNADELELGRRIYSEGVVSPGTELTGTRFEGTPVSGASAACVNCHRRSGMGQVEGNLLIQPITGDFLFAPGGTRRLATMDPQVSKLFNQTHEPYNDATLATAMRNGINNRGRAMSAAMPRYNLGDPELKALTAYLKQLSAQWSPGVTQSNIRFATVVTPDVNPARRKVFIDMMRSIFRQKNSSTMTAKQSNSRHHMTSAAEMILGTERKWDLEIWELQGAPESWGEQLAARYRISPVFALISGISNSTWQPVHDFCDREHVPCWFPSVDVPGKDRSSYAFYFSGGVTLEAAVLARHLLAQQKPSRRVVQIYRDGDAGRAAAQTLTQALAGSEVKVTDRILRSNSAAAESLRHALEALDREDAVVFWLGQDDIQALGKLKPAMGTSYFSAVLAKGEHAPLPADWRARSYLVYQYELPENRANNLEYFYVWLNTRKIPLVDEAMQSEVFFALNFMTDTLSEMLDNLYRDYLVERAETMLSKREGVKAAQETRDRLALGRVGDAVRRYGPPTNDKSARIPITNQQGGSHASQGTTLYPRLSLAPDQRFASIGAYIVRFADRSSKQLVAESGWIVP